MDAYGVFMFIISILFVVIQLLLINYLLRLERIGCECAMDWRRHYMIFYMIVTLIHMFVVGFVKRDMVPWIQTTVAVLGIMNVIVTLQYVNRLKREKCECSESFYKDVITLIAIFNAILYISLLIIVIYLSFTMSAFASGKSPTSGKKMMSVRKMFPKKK